MERPLLAGGKVDREVHVRQGLQQVKKGVGRQRAIQEPQQLGGLAVARRHIPLGKVFEHPCRSHLESRLVGGGEVEKAVDGSFGRVSHGFRDLPKRRDALPVVAAQRGGDVHRG